MILGFVNPAVLRDTHPQDLGSALMHPRRKQRTKKTQQKPLCTRACGKRNTTSLPASILPPDTTVEYSQQKQPQDDDRSRVAAEEKRKRRGRRLPYPSLPLAACRSSRSINRLALSGQVGKNTHINIDMRRNSLHVFPPPLPPPAYPPPGPERRVSHGRTKMCGRPSASSGMMLTFFSSARGEAATRRRAQKQGKIKGARRAKMNILRERGGGRGSRGKKSGDQRRIVAFLLVLSLFPTGTLTHSHR